MEILNVEQCFMGFFSHRLRYTVDFIGDGAQYSAIWTPNCANELITYERKYIHLSEAQLRKLARHAFKNHEKMLKNTYSSWQNGFWTHIERQYFKVAVHADYKKNKCISRKVDETQLNLAFDFLRNKLNIENIRVNDRTEVKFYDTSGYILEKHGMAFYSVKDFENKYTIYCLRDKDGNEKRGITEQGEFCHIPKSIEYELENSGVCVNDLNEIHRETQDLYYFICSAYIRLEKGDSDAKVIAIGDNAEMAMREP